VDIKKEVGTYVFGYDRVRVFLVGGSSGQFQLLPDDKGLPLMNIGIDHERYQDLLEVILHETQELIFARSSFRFRDAQTMSCEHSQYLFVFNHTQFSEMQARCAEFLSVALYDIHRAWKKWSKKKAKK
jgi:hypothetical protein